MKPASLIEPGDIILESYDELLLFDSFDGDGTLMHDARDERILLVCACGTSRRYPHHVEPLVLTHSRLGWYQLKRNQLIQIDCNEA